MEQPQAMPMDGASPAPNQDPVMGGEDPMGGDPAMGGEDPMMSGQDPMMGGDPAMGGESPIGDEDGDDSTTAIINQLSPEDKEAVRAYAESMLNKTENQEGENEEPMESEPPMMESVIFTKKQLKAINESFRDSEETRDDKTKLNKKKSQTVSNKSPFNSPKFK